MRRILLALSIFVFVNTQAQEVTSANRANWFKEARFGMFVHWGLYSILAGTYNGHTMPDKSFKIETRIKE